jgi:phosphoserine phosphatase
VSLRSLFLSLDDSVASLRDVCVLGRGATVAGVVHVVRKTADGAVVRGGGAVPAHFRVTESVDGVAPDSDVHVATLLGRSRLSNAAVGRVVEQLGGAAAVRAIRSVSRAAEHDAIDVEFVPAHGAAGARSWRDGDGSVVVVQRASLLRSHRPAVILGPSSAQCVDLSQFCAIVREQVGSLVVLLSDAADGVADAAALFDAVVRDEAGVVEFCRQRAVDIAHCVAINAAVGAAGLCFEASERLLLALPVLGIDVRDVAQQTPCAPEAASAAQVAFEWPALRRLLDTEGAASAQFESLAAGRACVALVGGGDDSSGAAQRFAVTLLGGAGKISFAFLAAVLGEIEAVAGSVRRMRQLSDSARDAWQCFELLVDLSGAAAAESVRPKLVDLGRAERVDVSLQADTFARRHRRMVVFDMDSTLIQDECIDEMGKFANVGAEIEAITRRAMNGELDFAQSLRSRVALLRGQPNRIFQHVLDHMTYTPDARLLCAALKRLGYTLMVVSGGFTNIISQVRADLKLDFAYGNTLEVVDDQLTGLVLGDIVGAKEKAVLLRETAARRGIPLSQVVAIGDGANDLPMLAEAALGVAFNAKPKVQEQAKFRINQPTMLALAYFAGFTSEQIRQAAGSE